MMSKKLTASGRKTKNSSWGVNPRNAPKPKIKTIPIHSCRKTRFRFIPRQTLEIENAPILRQNAAQKNAFGMFIFLKNMWIPEGIVAARASSIFDEVLVVIKASGGWGTD